MLRMKTKLLDVIGGPGALYFSYLGVSRGR